MSTLPTNTVPRAVWTDPMLFIACGFGVGAMPWMHGTFGTLVGVVFYLILNRLPLLLYVLIAIVLLVIGVFITDTANRTLDVCDHPAVVWDEIVGFLFVMVAIPQRWYFILLGFILFRVFDIWKPWPIKAVEKLPGGLGVMADDFVAAIGAWIVLWIIVWL